jgi:hypothetical protein
MARKGSFIPRSYAEYDKFFKNICQYVNQKTSGQDPEWTHIPAAEITALNAAYADWYTAYSKTFKAHTPAETAGVKAAYKSSYKVLSRFIQVWIRGFPDVVTDEDLKNMNIPPIDTTHTHIGKPETIPVFTTELRNIRSIVIPFREDTAPVPWDRRTMTKLAGPVRGKGAGLPASFPLTPAFAVSLCAPVMFSRGAVSSPYPVGAR